MSTSQERTIIFQDTMAWIESNQALSAAVRGAREGSKVYFEGDTPYEKARLEPGYGNGRFVRSMLEQVEMNLAQRVLDMEENALSNESLTTLEAQDIPDWKPRETEKKEEKHKIGFAC